MLCSLLESIILEPNAIDKSADISKTKSFLLQSFILSYIWAIGGNVIDTSRETFELFVKDLFENNPLSRYFCSFYNYYNYFNFNQLKNILF